MFSQIRIPVLLLFVFSLMAFPVQAQKDKDETANKETKKERKKENKEQDEAEDEECKVLLPSISETYEGGCKKGLAHGKGKATGKDVYEGTFRRGYPHGEGTFTYKNGDVYTGQFKKGLKDGEGTMVTTIENADTVLSGLWVDDFFVGAKPQHPVVTHRYGIDSYSFKRVRDGDRFLVEIMMNGLPNSDLENFTIISTSGTQFQMGRWIGFEGITFPVVCKVRYRTWNKLRTSRHDSIFEFELPEPGDWKIQIVN